MQVMKQGCACDDCHAKYPCNQCTTCRPESLCVTFVPEPPGIYDELHPPVCCTETQSARLRLILGRREIVERPITDPPTIRQFRDVTCETDAYVGSLTCDIASLSFNVTVESVGDQCVMTVSVLETVPNLFSETTEFVFSSSAGDFGWDQEIEFEGEYLVGTITLSAAPTGYMNTKFRGMCSPEELEAAPNDCEQCKSCKHCRCIPKRMCIGYSVAGACGPTVKWKSVPFDPDEQAYEATFTIKNADDTEEERTVRLDFCWHRTFDNYGNTATSESLFNQCVFSLQVANSPHQFSEKIQLDWERYEGGGQGPPTLVAAGCIWDSAEQLSYTISDDEEFLYHVEATQSYLGYYDTSQHINVSDFEEHDEVVMQTERVLIRYGSCGCPDDENDNPCSADCPDLSETNPHDGLCGITAVHLEFDAPGFSFDGVVVPLATGANPRYYPIIMQSPPFPAIGFGGYFLPNYDTPNNSASCNFFVGVVNVCVCGPEGKSTPAAFAFHLLKQDWCNSTGEAATKYELRWGFYTNFAAPASQGMFGTMYPTYPPIDCPEPDPPFPIFDTTTGGGFNGGDCHISYPTSTPDCEPLLLEFDLVDNLYVKTFPDGFGQPAVLVASGDCPNGDGSGGPIKVRITL